MARGKGEHSLHLWPREAAWAFRDSEEDPGPEGGAGSGEPRTEGALNSPRPTDAPALPVPTAGVLARLGPGAGDGVSCVRAPGRCSCDPPSSPTLQPTRPEDTGAQRGSEVGLVRREWWAVPGDGRDRQARRP